MAYPTNPTTSDTYVLGTKTWTYNGTNWVNQATFASGSNAGVAFSDLTSTPTTLSGYGITDGATGTSESVPVGTIIYHSANTPPTNFIKANGDAVSRTTYSDLFTVIGTTFGSGDGSSTFNVPDLRGEFPRGWDDSRGIDNGRNFGSSQADELKAHTHTFSTHYNTGAGGVPLQGTSSPVGTVTTSSTGGSETRPRNIALLACIKYQATSSGGGGGGGSLSNIVEDTTPQLGGNLDAQTFDITTTGKILYANMYATEGDLPSATTYHGMFAHVHGTGAGYFAHGGNWIKLANHADLSSAGSTTFNAIGTYCLGFYTGLGTHNGGATFSGSSIATANTYAGGGGWSGSSTSTLSGTWRLMGNIGYYNQGSTASNANVSGSLFVRIS